MRLLFLITLVVGYVNCGFLSVDARAQSTEEQLTAEAFFVKGMTQAYIGKHDLATGYFQASLKLRPEAPEVMAAMARSLWELEDADAALFYASRAFSSQSPPDDVLFLSRMLEETDRTGEAIELLKDALLSNESPALLIALADLLIDEGLYTDAASVLSGGQADRTFSAPWYADNLESLTDESIRALLDSNQHDLFIATLASAWYELHGQIDEAVDALAPFTSADEEIAARINYLEGMRVDGAGLEASSDSGDPIAQIQEMLASPTPEDLLQAEELIAVLEESGHDAMQTKMMRGDVMLAAGKYAEASRLYEAILESDVRNVEVWQKAARSARLAGSILHAVYVADEGLLFFPGNMDLINTLALASLAIDEQQRRPYFFLDALTYLPTNSLENAVHLQLAAAWSHHLAGEHDASVALIETTTDSESASPYALALRARVDAARARYESALDDVATAISFNPDDFYLILASADVYHRTGKNSEALIQVQKLNQMGSTPETFELAGDIYFQLGQLEDARRMWTESLALDPNRQSVVSKLDRLPQ